uniref:Uncharacterized protein n=1 Tax=Opuntia streptacantha TaxID=393608 RepID=A0A7C9DYZ2_OPUST
MSIHISNHTIYTPIMDEEFQESDVVFSDAYSSSSHQTSSQSATINKIQRSKNKTKRQTTHRRNPGNSSPPMNIPETGTRCFDLINYTHDHDDLDGDEEVGCIGGERLPPHLIVARRISNLGREMACSFYVEDENGRILKGRNLCQVRNSILRLTGFIET